jgi:PAS domain S-box-containing protein
MTAMTALVPSKRDTLPNSYLSGVMERQPQTPSWSTREKLLACLVLSAAYVVAGRLGLLISVSPGYATAVFLPAGLAVAGMYVGGPFTLVGTFIGSFVLNVWVGSLIRGQVDSADIATGAFIALASAAQAGIGGTLLRRAIGHASSLDAPRDLLYFLLLTPIFCLTSATLSVTGIWAASGVKTIDILVNWVIWWVGDTLGVLVGLPVVLVFAGRPRELWRSRALTVAAPMILSFGLFTAIFVLVSGWEKGQSLLEFELRSQQLVDTTRSTLEEQAAFIEQLSNSFTGRRMAMDRHEFHNLVEKLLERFPAVQAVEWAPRVNSRERQSFETAQQSNAPNFAIREGKASGRSGDLIPASVKDQYYPVTFVEPLAGNEAAMGFDLASNPDRNKAIESALATDKVTATAPVRLVQERGEQPGILLMQAVPEGSSGPGLVLVVLRMGAFTAKLNEAYREILDLKFGDEASARSFFDDIPESAAPSYRSEFEFGSRRYIVQTTPSALYLARRRGWESWIVMAAGVLGTGLIGALLLLGTGETYRLEILTDKLRASEMAARPFRAAVNASPAAKIMVDANGLIEFANPMAERMFGYEIVELIGQPIDILVPARSRAAHAGLRRGFAVNPSARPMGAGRELYGVRRDGSEFPVEIELTPADSESGPIVLASIVDITQRKRAENELAQQAGELLIANQRLAQFAYVASHDLQEPLRKMAIYAGLVEEAVANSDREEIARATSVIKTSAARARRLVDNLLNFSRATNSRTKEQPLDLRAEVELALSDLSASIEETGARVTVDIPPIVVPADHAQLRRLIQNIVSNAIKYHKPGASPVIAIRAVPAGEAKAMLAIADDGIGFDEKFAREIFEPFKRLHDAARYAGTGIGLAICKAIADRYGWTIGVRSRPGQGATFMVTLPTAELGSS